MSSETKPSNLSLTTAFYIGVPVLVGASCYYLYSSRYSSSANKSSQKKAEAKVLTPLEQLAQLKQIGNQNFARKDYDAAIEHYTKALELIETLQPSIKPQDLAIFYQNRAACYESLEEPEKVISDCTKALEHNQTYTKAYTRRARAYEKLKQYEQAMVDAFSANLLEKFQNQTSMALTESLVKASSQDKAAKAMKNRKLDWPSNQTIRSYFSAFTRDPIRDKLSDQDIRKPEKLQTLLDEANKKENENDPMSLLIRGSCLSLMGDLKTAQELFDRIMTFNDDECPPTIKSNALVKKSALVISEPSGDNAPIEKELEVVMDLLKQASKIDPTNPDAYLHLAQAKALSEKFDEAIECLNKAIELKNDFYSAKAQKLYMEFKVATRDSASLSKLQDLLKSFKSAVEENPEALDLHQMYAQVLTEMNDFDKADQILINISKLDPTDGSVYVSRALLQFHLNSNPEEVASLLTEALKIDPKLIFAYEILGSIETHRDRNEEAIKIFETALSYANTESEYVRCYGLLDSAKAQKRAAELLGMLM